MADYFSDRSGTSIDTILDDANTGNVGKDAPSAITGDLDTIGDNGFYAVASTATNNPAGTDGALYVSARAFERLTQIFISNTTGAMHRRYRSGAGWQAWQELYHSGNTGLTVFDVDSAPQGVARVAISTSSLPRIRIESVGVAQDFPMGFQNGNGDVGYIATNGSATEYNTASDPRLKSAFSPVAAIDAWANFNAIYAAFGEFSFNAAPLDTMYGFDAHMLIDSGIPHLASEGEGGRIDPVGTVYQAFVAATYDLEDVELTPEIPELRITPAGVDYSKIVPQLMGVIKDLEERVIALENP